MIHVMIDEAATRLNELVNSAVQGEEVILEQADGRQVRLSPVRQAETGEVEISNEALADLDDRELNHYLC